MRNNITVLHVGWGFRPWRFGGLIEYAEDLMEIQSKQGYDVHYFFSGRHYPFIKKPKLIEWKRNGIIMHEILNSIIIHSGDIGTLKPDLDINETISENFFVKVINKIKPNIIHIQELSGLPSSLIDIASNMGIPTIMTLQDYFLLCPTLKLFDSTRNICKAQNIGTKCIKCCENAPYTNMLKLQTIRYELRKTPILFKLAKYFYRFSKKYKVNSILSNVIKILKKREQGKYLIDENLADIFQQRRDINIKRLNKVNLLIAQSLRVEEIYRQYLNRNNNIITIHLTVKHIENIKPKKMESVDYPIIFATLNGCASIPKGSQLILETLKILNNKGLDKYFQFHIFGGLDPKIKEDILNFNNVFYHGVYDVRDLDSILEKIHVGIVPSVWEEAFGYVGIEFLAKGIPIIGNKIGGIPDYTKDGNTGWLNKSCSHIELANIIEGIIKEPTSILAFNRNILYNRNKIIKNMLQHFFEMEEIYKSIITR